MYRMDYPSPVGVMTLASDGESLTGAWFLKQKYYGAGLPANAQTCPDLPVFRQAVAWLDAYFGLEALPPLPPLAPAGTPFRQAVWELLGEIPWGATTTYGELAQQLRMSGMKASALAVGGAVSHNPLSLFIPCHRVVGADGSLTGYAAGIGVKSFLLTLEREDDDELLLY